MRLRRSRLARVLIVCVLISGGFVIGIFVLLPRLDPVWYDPPDVADTRVVELAERVEYRLVAEAQKVRPDEPRWALRITEDQINAWLAVRLREWVRGRGDVAWPEEIRLVQFHFEPDGISLAVERLTDSGSEQVFVLRGGITIDEAGEARIEVDRAGVGRLATRGDALQRLLDFVTGYLSENGQGDVAAALTPTLRGERSFAARIPLADDRTVDIRDIAVESGAIVIECITR